MSNKLDIKHFQKRSKALNEAINPKYKLSDSIPIVHFIDHFIDCEIVALKLCVYYYSDKNKNYSDYKIKLNVLKNAISHFGIILDNGVIEKIFSTKLNTLKNMSLRSLRNGYLHNRNMSYSKDIIKNYTFYEKIMNTFLIETKKIFN